MLVVKYFRKTLFYCNIFRKKFFVMNKSLLDHKLCSELVNTKSSKPFVTNVIQTDNNLEYEILTSPVKSASDKKEYRVIRLRNGLTACLIYDKSPIPESDEESDLESEEEDEESASDSNSDSDDDSTIPEQKMAAASLCVNVGSFSDPKNIPGMAHFLEHMVFMGSEKYPEENDFDSFLSKRGGSDNASTDCEMTTFYFECLEKDLHTAVDKFSQFFISPLMNRGSITREREAIDSEFLMALPSDTYRKEQLLASFATKESPVSTFTWGNLITLRDNVSEDELYSGVHEFRKRHYSAHRMTLAIQARLPLDDLQSYVLECFSNVPSNNLPPDDFQQFKNVFDTSQFTKLYYVQPVNDVIVVELTWALPSLLNKYKSKPHQYVSSLIGDEGKGSLLAYLRKKVWVLSVSAGNGESGSEHNSMYTLFAVTMYLTNEGLEHLQEVIGVVFSYINMLRKLGPQERLYNEMKIIADTAFKFATEEPAAEFVESLSESMQIYPPEDYITGSELFFEYDPEAIKLVLDSLVPRKMNVIVMCSNLPVGLTYDKTEKWFGTKYTEQDISEEWLKKWEKIEPFDELALPPPNPFLTKDFTILADEENHPDYPKKIFSNELLELWYRKDQKFKLPVAYYHFYLINPMILEAPKMSVLSDFYVQLIQISLVEEYYPALLAQYLITLKSSDKGLVLGVSGYNEKLHVLIELVAKHILNFKSNTTEEMFQAVKEKAIRVYHNSLLKPSALAKDIRLNILINNFHSIVDKYNVASSVNFEDVLKFSDDFMRKLYVKVLVQGNVDKEHAIKVVNDFARNLNYKAIDPALYPNFRVSQIPKGSSYCCAKSLNVNDVNSVITNYYQSGPFTLQDSVLVEVLMMIIEEPLFDTLRTKEQLGYDVRCSDRDTFGILGFSITVNAQATKNSTSYVEQRIEEFINHASELLEKMSEEDFEAIKIDLIKTKRCADVHLKEEVNRNWSEIEDEDYMFDRIQLEIAAIEKLTLKECKEWWETHTLGGNEENFRKLSVQIAGFDNAQEDREVRSVLDKGAEIALSLIDCDSKTAEGEDSKSFVKDIAKFKENLYLYPVLSKHSPST